VHYNTPLFTAEFLQTMPRVKLSTEEKRSIPVYVLLRPREVKALDAVRKVRRMSRGALLRDAFLRRYWRTHPELREMK
jgi:hypothetical protein